jgi:hypothetical protein
MNGMTAYIGCGPPRLPNPLVSVFGQRPEAASQGRLGDGEAAFLTYVFVGHALSPAS